ncbi:MAG: M48 family metallopeptidase [Pseudomonadota bacterium]
MMNFFDAQDRSRRNTRWLIVMFGIATLLIVAAVTIIVEVTLQASGMANGMALTVSWVPSMRALLVGVCVLAFILLASGFRMAQLGSGGARVAQELGGTLVNSDSTDLDRQRLRNVVEEMSIASGVPVPQIFVLEEESGINAFAAGFGTADAAIAVTRGTLEQLNRDELQGVIAHEFSHILNGDMRLNVRLIGILFGIIAIGHIGRIIMRTGRPRRMALGRRNNNGQAPLIIAGLLLFIIGSVGVVMARLIRAGVSRQREFLADASAVQFTRQTSGIAGALAKIANPAHGSRITTVDSDEFSHMLIAPGARRAWLNAMASHPPIEARIAALDPALAAQLQPGTGSGASGAEQLQPHAATSSLAGGSQPTLAIDADSIAERVGNPGDGEVALAAAIRASIPADIYDAAHSREWSLLLTIALALSDDVDVREAQLDLLFVRLGELRCERVRRYADTMAELGSRYRLPLLELCFPSLKERPAGQLRFLMELLDAVQNVPAQRGLREYAFRQLLSISLDASLNPAAKAHRRLTHFGHKRTLQAAKMLISIVAHEGHDDPVSSRTAFVAGIEKLNAGSADHIPVTTLREADQVLDTLGGLKGNDLKSLVSALIATVSSDGRITVDESELMRLISAALHCPLPPIIDSALMARVGQELVTRNPER